MFKLGLKSFLAFYLLFLSFSSFAAVPTWQIIPNESHLTFTATQNGAPVSGEFKTFSGDIAVDPNQLNASHVKVIVDVASVTSSYQQVADTLKSSDWFDVKIFPQAIFEAHEFSKTGDKTYQVKGILTIRNKTVPITLDVTQEEYSSSKAKVNGNTTIKRSVFGVGQGEWAATDTIKDEVQINFVLSVVKK